MSVRYEVVRLLLRLAVAVALALALAAILAVARSGGYRDSLEMSCYLVGVLSFLMAAVGNSPGRGYALDVESALAGSSRWDTVLGRGANSPSSTLGPAVPFVVVAVILILLGLALS